jgi:hypothetical protein
MFDEEHVGQTQGARQAQRGVGADSALAMHDLVDAAWRYIDCLGDPVLRDPHRFEELGQKDLAGVGGWEVCHGFSF